MYKNLFFCLWALIFSLFSPLFAVSDYFIVFIHIGKSIPEHVPVALAQARLFNPECPIIFVANQQAIDQFSPYPDTNITYVPCESLIQTEEHTTFRAKSGLNSQWREGFWLYTSERFLYLQDLMVQYGLKNVFHLEHDNLLYVNLETQLPIFISQYPGLGITMDNDSRCIPGFVYVANPEIMTQLARCFSDNANSSKSDMEILALFKQINRRKVKNLPIITREYVNQQPLRSSENHTTSTPQDYYKNIDLFQSIFDAAALGQYLGGIDPRNGHSEPGFINEACLFNSSLLTYKWITDKKGRKIPFVVYGAKKLRINNLHIHSKNLWKFASKSFD